MKSGASQVCYCPRRGLRRAPPSRPRSGEARRGRPGGVWRLRPPARPAHPGSPGSRAQGRTLRVLTRLGRFVWAQAYLRSPPARKRTKSLDPHAPASAATPRAGSSPRLLKTPLSAWEAQVRRRCPHAGPKSLSSDNWARLRFNPPPPGVKDLKQFRIVLPQTRHLEIC